MQTLLAHIRSNTKLTIVRAVAIVASYGIAFYLGWLRYDAATEAQKASLPSLCDDYSIQLGDVCKVDMREVWADTLNRGGMTLLIAGTVIAIAGMLYVAVSPKAPCVDCMGPCYLHEEPGLHPALVWAVLAGGVVAVPGILVMFASTFV